MCGVQRRQSIHRRRRAHLVVAPVGDHVRRAMGKVASHDLALTVSSTSRRAWFVTGAVACAVMRVVEGAEGNRRSLQIGKKPQTPRYATRVARELRTLAQFSSCSLCCGIGSCGVPRPSLADYVIGTGTPRGATAAAGA
jgi:hypothetical protein